MWIQKFRHRIPTLLLHSLIILTLFLKLGCSIDGIPAAPSDLKVTAISSSQIDLTWKKNSTNEQGFRIERDFNDGFKEIATVTASQTQYSDTGLNPNSTYLYRVCAYNASGNSTYTKEVQGTTHSLINNSNIRIEPSPSVCVGEEVYFDASKITDLINPASYRYKWNFGDSSIPERQGRSIVHSYPRPGTYRVTLTITTATNAVVRTETVPVTVSGAYKKLAPRPAYNPLLYYSFEDNLEDKSSHALNGSWEGGSGIFTEGAEKKAAQIGGTVYIHASDEEHVIGGSAGLTVSFWAKKSANNSDGYIITYPGLFSLRLREGGQWLVGEVTTVNGTQASDAWYMGAENTNWHHYALVYDGQWVRLFFDGREQIMENKCPRPLTGTLSSSGNHLYIGVNSSSGTPFNGEIDEVKIYNRALTIDEIFIGFELWHANFHARIAQYIYVKIPGEVTRDPANTLEVKIIGDNGYSATLANKGQLHFEEKVLLKNAELPAGNYTLRARLYDVAGNIIDTVAERFSKSYDGRPDIGIDENNALRINGDLFFPVTPCGLRNFEVADWAAAGYINSLHTQGFWGMIGPPVYTPEGWEEYLDLGIANGLKSIGPNSWNGNSDGRNADISIIENYVSLLRDHSGMLAWIWRDEPELGGNDEYLPAEVLGAWTNRSHALDSAHPVATNLVGHWIAGEYLTWGWNRSGEYLYLNNAGFFGQRTLIADIYSMDYYPIEWAAPHSRNATMAILTKCLDALRERTYNLVPCTSWVETDDINEADGSVRYPTPWPPSPEQLKMLIWINVVHGMKGINWFPWHSGTPDNNYPIMSNFLNQITRLTPVVLGPEINPVVTVTADDARIDTMVRSYQGKTYLFAVRVSEVDTSGQSIGYPVTATLKIDGVASGTAHVFDENRSVAVTNGTLQDTFDPCAVHIYEIY